MSIYNITFSPTGGTQKVADILVKGLGAESTNIDLCNREMPAIRLSANDVAVIAVPVFGGRVPALAAQRMQGIVGNGTRAIIVAVYGNRAYEDALVELEDICTAQGFAVIAAVAALAEHSIARQFAAGRPDADDAQQLGQFAQAIKGKLESDNGGSKVSFIPGNRPYKEFKGGGPTPVTDDICNGCGTCVSACPVGAISDDGQTIDNTICIQCARCMAVCPLKAKHFPAMMLEAVGARLASVGADQRKEAELFID